MGNILFNDKCEVIIDSLGAELKSLFDKENKIEYIWQADKAYWAKSSPTLFPYIGNVKNDKYSLDGVEYQMTKHGFVRDKEFELVEKKNEFLSFLYKSNEKTLKMFPFNFELFINYYLKEKELIIEYIIKNLSDREMYYNIGGHTAYNFDIDKGNKYIVFEKTENEKSYTFNLESGLTTNNKIEVLNNQKELLITYDLFKYDTLFFEKLESNFLILDSRDENKRIKITFADFPYLAIWTPNAPFICIEPWYGMTDFEDSIDAIENKKGIFIIDGKNEKKLKTKIEIL
ncbi:aldose 1-epimerase family protein [Clostridiaceae bacterium HSG29]|nr:aldose 1-epimerase family protein [Clostridiaceae bacterium HSG29]